MGWTKFYTWPVELGILVVTRPEEMGRYADLLMLCDHDGVYMDGKNGRVWVEPGCALTSERFLARRWDTNKTKVGRFLDFCFDSELFFYSDPDPEGTWLKPHDGQGGPQNGPQNEPQDGPQNGPKNQKYISRSWYLDKEGMRRDKRGCGGEKGRARDFDPKFWHQDAKVKFPESLRTPEVIDVLNEWIEYRSLEKHAPVVSHRPLNLVFEEVGHLTPALFVEAVQHAMGKGWQGIERSWLPEKFQNEPQNVFRFRGRNEPQKTQAEVIAEAEAILSKGARR